MRYFRVLLVLFFIGSYAEGNPSACRKAFDKKKGGNGAAQTAAAKKAAKKPAKKAAKKPAKKATKKPAPRTAAAPKPQSQVQPAEATAKAEPAPPTPAMINQFTDNLVKAVKNRDAEEMNKALKAGARVENHFMHMAVEARFFDGMRALKRKLGESSLTAQDENGRVPLQIAIQANLELDWVKYLYAPQVLDNSDYQGRTSLHYTVDARNQEVRDFLLKEGASQTITDYEGYTPAHYAVAKGADRSWVESLSESVAAQEVMSTPNTRGDYPLVTALREADANVIGAVYRKTPKYTLQEFYPLFETIEAGRSLDVLRYVHSVLETDTVADAGRVDEMVNGQNILHVALQQRYNDDVVMYLIEDMGVDVNNVDSRGNNALMEAMRNGRNITVLQAVFARTEDVSVKNEKGLTAFDFNPELSRMFAESVLKASGVKGTREILTQVTSDSVKGSFANVKTYLKTVLENNRGPVDKVAQSKAWNLGRDAYRFSRDEFGRLARDRENSKIIQMVKLMREQANPKELLSQVRGRVSIPFVQRKDTPAKAKEEKAPLQLNTQENGDKKPLELESPEVAQQGQEGKTEGQQNSFEFADGQQRSLEVDAKAPTTEQAQPAQPAEATAKVEPAQPAEAAPAAQPVVSVWRATPKRWWEQTKVSRDNFVSATGETIQKGWDKFYEKYPRTARATQAVGNRVRHPGQLKTDVLDFASDNVLGVNFTDLKELTQKASEGAMNMLRRGNNSKSNPAVFDVEGKVIKEETPPAETAQAETAPAESASPKPEENNKRSWKTSQGDPIEDW